MTHEARLVTRFTGSWELYVITDSPCTSDWPTHDFPRASAPNWAERVEALTGLGYEPVDAEADWEWLELSDRNDCRVRLLASLPVRPVQDGGAL
ncbi:DUF6303 family protein [Streptomyces sp. NPDC056361]|uniref:DUF6303 family protein n=1 Tax=Streptomyces sp. NPDC056361 TaxID=3345795 RepID=UPI0035DDD668